MKIKVRLLSILLLLFSSAHAVNPRNNADQQITEDGISVKNLEVSSENIERSPRFPGGDKALLDFIKREMRYPECVKKEGVEGRVIVCFYVETDGSLTDFKIIRSTDSRLNEEALRIVKKMPKWEPGQIGEKIVRMKYFLPIIFRCNNSTNDSIMVLSPITQEQK